MDLLPNEIRLEFCTFLDGHALLRLAQTARDWFALIRRDKSSRVKVARVKLEEFIYINASYIPLVMTNSRLSTDKLLSAIRIVRAAIGADLVSKSPCDAVMCKIYADSQIISPATMISIVECPNVLAMFIPIITHELLGTLRVTLRVTWSNDRDCKKRSGIISRNIGRNMTLYLSSFQIAATEVNIIAIQAQEGILVIADETPCD